MRHKKEEDGEEEEKTIGMSIFIRAMETMTNCFLGEKSRYGLLHTKWSYLYLRCQDFRTGKGNLETTDPPPHSPHKAVGALEEHMLELRDRIGF